MTPGNASGCFRASGFEEFRTPPLTISIDRDLVALRQREAQRLRQQIQLRADEALSEDRARVRYRMEQARRESMEALAEVSGVTAAGL